MLVPVAGGQSRVRGDGHGCTNPAGPERVLAGRLGAVLTTTLEADRNVADLRSTGDTLYPSADNVDCGRVLRGEPRSGRR